MKHIYLVVQLLVVFVLLTGCSSKELFKFSKNTGRFSPYQEVKKVTHTPDSVVISGESAKVEINDTYAPVLIASNSHLVNASLPRQEEIAEVTSAYVAVKINTPINKKVAKSSLTINTNSKNQSTKSKVNKQVHEASLIGFILSLGAIGILLAGSPLTILASLSGAILSLIGLRKTNKNPEKFSGKGLAWAGIILGFLIPLFILGFLLAFAGAI